MKFCCLYSVLLKKKTTKKKKKKKKKHLANGISPTLSAKIDEKEMHTIRISVMCFKKV